MHDCHALNCNDDRAARLRIGLTYLWRHRRLPNLAHPARFTELIQRRKLHDRDPRMPAMADKVAVKSIVADRLGREWIIPMLWSGTELAPTSQWERPVVVKSRHGCNHVAFVRNCPREWLAACSASSRWMRRDYGWWLDEWLYGEIPRGLLIEPMIGDGRQLPVDYKVFVFGGRATHVQVHLDRVANHHWVVHDRDWRPIADDAPAIARPTALSAMLSAAEELAHGFDFVRIDFYQPAEQPLFGEISFYPGSGLAPFDPPELDAAMGRLWLHASRERCVEPQEIGSGAAAVSPSGGAHSGKGLGKSWGHRLVTSSAAAHLSPTRSEQG